MANATRLDYCFGSGNNRPNGPGSATRRATQITASATNICGTELTNINVRPVGVFAPPSIVIDNSNPCNGILLEATPPQDAQYYKWIIPEGWKIISANDSANIIRLDAANGEVTGQVAVFAAANGCLSPTATDLEVTDPTLRFYNVFTPDGDGVNEQWIVDRLSIYPQNELHIYNRWGAEVFSARPYLNNWDAAGLSDGTYYYQLKVDVCEEGQEKTGYITILRR